MSETKNKSTEMGSPAVEILEKPEKDQGSSPVSPDIKALVGKVRKATQKNIKGTGKQGRPSNAELAAREAAANEALQVELDKVLSPDAMAGLVALPGETLSVTTGWTGWRLSPRETTTLAHTGAASARYLLAVDPKWLCLALFLGNALMAYGTRAGQYAKLKKKRDQK